MGFGFVSELEDGHIPKGNYGMRSISHPQLHYKISANVIRKLWTQSWKNATADHNRWMAQCSLETTQDVGREGADVSWGKECKSESTPLCRELNDQRFQSIDNLTPGYGIQ